MFCLRIEKKWAIGNRKRGNILFIVGELIRISAFLEKLWKESGGLN